MLRPATQYLIIWIWTIAVSFTKYSEGCIRVKVAEGWPRDKMKRKMKHPFDLLRLFIIFLSHPPFKVIFFIGSSLAGWDSASFPMYQKYENMLPIVKTLRRQLFQNAEENEDKAGKHWNLGSWNLIQLKKQNITSFFLTGGAKKRKIHPKGACWAIQDNYKHIAPPPMSETPYHNYMEPYHWIRNGSNTWMCCTIAALNRNWGEPPFACQHRNSTTEKLTGYGTWELG